MKKQVALAITLIALMFTVISATVYAQTGYVNIGTPNSSTLGVQSLDNGYWIGQFPITLNPGTQDATQCQAYCMTPGGTVYEGSQYSYSEVMVPTNDPTWQEISYILTWYAPTTDTQAAIDQVAIWMLLGQNPAGSPPQYTDFELAQSIITQASALVSQAMGMNMALEGATMRWVEPSTGSAGNPGGPISTTASPGSTVTFGVQVFNSTGDAQSNVQVEFNATISAVVAGEDPSVTLSPSYINAPIAVTDSDGIAYVTVTVPPGTPMGSMITLTASSPTVWPVEYLDLLTNNPGTQNLIGLSTQLDLTTTYNVYVQAYIFVLPESALGALSALVACGAGFAIYYRAKPRIKQNV
jgi:hypothetical protein